MAMGLNGALSELDMLDLDEMLDTQPAASVATAGDNIAAFYDVPLTVSLEVATTEVTLGELSRAVVGDVLPLDKAIGEALDVKVNGVFFAKAEVVMVDGKYGLKFVSNPQQPATTNA